MNSERIQEIQAGTGYPQSMSVAQALNQVWNEVAQDQAATIAALRTSADELAARVEALGAWSCSRCGARFEKAMPPAALEGVTLCSSCAEVERLKSELRSEQRMHDNTVRRRDFAEDWADKLAYAIESEEVIGEHSNANNPWENALALIEDWNEKANAERTRADELAARCEALEKTGDALLMKLQKQPGPIFEDEDYTAFRDFAQALYIKPPASLAAHDSRVLVTPGVAAIAAERKRQMEVEGWTPTHDDEYGNQQLPAAAVAYLLHDFGVPVLDRGSIPALHGRIWPWGFMYWKPKGPQRNLVRAGALIAAELDRLDRVGTAASETEGGE